MKRLVAGMLVIAALSPVPALAAPQVEPAADTMAAFQAGDFARMLPLAERDLNACVPVEDSCFSLMMVVATARIRTGDVAGGETVALDAIRIGRQAAKPRWSDIGTLWYMLANVVAMQGRIDDARGAARQAYEIFSAIYGPDHEMTAQAAAGYGWMALPTGQVEEAVKLFTVATDYYSKAGDRTLADLIGARQGLVTALRTLERWEDAEPAARTLISDATRAGNVDALVDASATYARILRAQGREQEVEAFYRTQLAGFGSAGGPAVAAAAGGLAQSLEKAGDLAGAEPLRRRALDAVLGDAGAVKQRAEAISALAENLSDQGRYAELEVIMRGYVTDLTARDGADAASTLAARIGVGSAFMGLRRDDEAEAILRQVLTVQAGSRGLDVLEAVTTYVMLGGLAYRKGEPEAAQRYTGDALALLQRLGSSDVMAFAPALQAMALSLSSDGRNEEALAIQRKILSIYETAAGAKSQVWAETAVFTARMMIPVDGPAAAEALLNKAMPLLGGGDSAARVQALDGMAQVLGMQGKDVAAEASYRDALAVADRMATPGSSLPASVRSNFADFLMARKRYADARPLLAKAYGVERSRVVDDNRRILAAYNYAYSLYGLGGDVKAIRALSREAAQGVIARLFDRKDFDARAQRELRVFRPVFRMNVAANWLLATRR